ncbi:MAG: dihydroorotase [Ktedonobacterales bacterium]
MVIEGKPRQVVLLRGARIVDPSQNIDGRGELLIVNGRVAAIGDEAEVRSQLAAESLTPEIHDLPKSWVLAPGLVDLHTHLREPGFESKETILTGGRAAARGGFTSICCMPNTDPVIDSPSVMERVMQLARSAPVRVYPVASITRGQLGAQLSDLLELAAAGAVAFSDDGHPVSGSKLMRSALEYASTLGLPLVEHCQDLELAGNGVMNEGPVATLLGLAGWPSVAEEVMLARDLALVHLTGTRYHAAHLSTAAGVALIREAKRQRLPVTAEVTPHHLLLTDSWVAGERTGPLADALAQLELPLPPGQRYDTSAKVNPPLRSPEDCRALLGGLRDGTIDAVATDHAPHTVVEKDCEFDQAAFGISGLETALSAMLALVHTGELGLSPLIAALSLRPARAWNLEAGTLRTGAAADLVIFDPDQEWVVDTAHFASLGHNTPLAGVTLRGRVQETWVAGKPVYTLAS